MKKLLFFLLLCLYFLVGNIIFNTFCTVTEVIIVNNLGIHVNFLNRYINNTINTIYIYTLIYFLILVSIYIYNIHFVKELNAKLKKIRKEE